MQSCVTENLNRGLELGLFRDNINIEFISKIYFSGMMVIKDRAFFPLKNFSMQTLMNNYLEYHLRGICTPKGLETLTGLIRTNQNQ